MLHKAKIVKQAHTEPLNPKPAATPLQIKGHARVVSRSYVDAIAEAELVRTRAQSDAEETRTRAETKAEEIRKTAHAEGYAQGLTDAVAQTVFLTQLEADSDARELDRSVELAHLLAERLLGKALELDATVSAALARQALSEIRGASRVTLFVNRKDHAGISASLDAGLTTQAAIELRVDESLQVGDFRLQTNIGALDASLGSRLSLLSQKLREGLKK